MPGRRIVNGQPYRYGYQGEFAETDEETGKPAFQLRIYDPRINRWLTPDPYGQYHSPYMAMGNKWTSGVDPDGGCFKEDGSGEECDPAKGIATGYGGNDWIYNTDEGEWNLLSGQEYYIGKGADYYQFSDALHQFRDNRNWNLQQAQDHFRKTGAIVEDNTLAELFTGGSLKKAFTNTFSKKKGTLFYVGDGAEDLARSIALDKNYRTIYSTWYGAAGRAVNPLLSTSRSRQMWKNLSEKYANSVGIKDNVITVFGRHHKTGLHTLPIKTKAAWKTTEFPILDLKGIDYMGVFTK